MNQLLRSPSDSHEALFPIREVSRLTGVNPVTLRAWERRYGLITPTRTEGGHRLYSQIDVNTIRSIMAWIERGVAVSKVGRILAATRDMEARALGPQRAIDSAGQQAVQAQLRQSVNDFDEGRLFQLYEQMLARYSPAQAFEDMLMPVWHEFAERRDAFGQFSEWLFLDSFLRARALQCVSLERNAAEHRVLLVAMPGSCRELELWVAGLLMGTPQVAISVLAPGQPLGELALVCGKVHPDALVLFSNELPTIDLPKRLIRLGLGLNCPMLLAGELADLMQESLQGSAIGCLGSSGVLMQRRLQQFLAGRLDT